MNNDMLPVGTTFHINPKDIKWESSGDLISRSALKKAIEPYRYATDGVFEGISLIIDNASIVEPRIEPRIEYGTDGQPYKLFISGGQIMPDNLQSWKYEERPQGDWIKWNFKTFGAMGDWEYKCSKCEKVYGGEYNFCPNCGADMRGGAE